MNPELFLADLEKKPALLARLADSLTRAHPRTVVAVSASSRSPLRRGADTPRGEVTAGPVI